MAKIMVVDDSPLILTMLDEALRGWGHQVVTVADGAGVVAEFRKTKPDLVILDYNMPGASGAVVLERLRGLTAGEKVPVIFLSATSYFELEMVIPPSDLVRLREKPVDLPALLKDLGELLPR